MVKGVLDNITDWYLFNGNIWDMDSNGFKPGEMVIRDGRIEEMTFNRKIPSVFHADAEKIDLEGGYVCPGVIDSHMHLLQWSITRKGLDLSRCRSKDDIINSVTSVINGDLDDPIFDSHDLIFGMDFDDSNFVDGILNNGLFLEKEFSDTPVVVRRICGHKALGNSEGLGVLGIPDEASSNGIILEEDAMRIPWKLPLTDGTLTGFLSDGIGALYSKGVLGGVDIIPSSQLERMDSTYSKLDMDFLLTISVIRDGKFNLREKEIPVSWDDIPGDLHNGSGIPLVFEKFFLDGSIGSRTASFSEEYIDAGRASLIMDDKVFHEKVQQSHDDGLIPMIHCIGDTAISQGIRIMEERGDLYRLEHCEAINKDHLKKMKGGNGALCLQPNFQFTWGRKGGLYEKSLGDAYLRMNPFKTIADSELPWCFGTDMMPPDPLYAIQGAVEHPDPKFSLIREEALRGFTDRSKRLSFISDVHLSQLRVGLQANIIIINRKFHGINYTFFKGKIVYLHHHS